MRHVLDNEMPDVNFLPWIGEKYFDKPLNGRVLILGESHYAESPLVF